MHEAACLARFTRSLTSSWPTSPSQRQCLLGGRHLPCRPEAGLHYYRCHLVGADFKLGKGIRSRVYGDLSQGKGGLTHQAGVFDGLVTCAHGVLATPGWSERVEFSVLARSQASEKAISGGQSITTHTPTLPRIVAVSDMDLSLSYFPRC
jgi:hypothetical protein